MPLTIGHLTTEVIVEPDRAAGVAGGSAVPPAPELPQAVRRELAVIARDEMRTRAERFDD